MIDAQQYMATVEAYFGFLVTEFGFELHDRKIRGNAFYDVQYKTDEKIVSVSYENIEDYLQVVVFLLRHGELPDYDDPARTLQLNRLTRQLMPKIGPEAIRRNNDLFAGFSAAGEWERKLLKAAKDLRLCLEHFVAGIDTK